MSEKYKRLFIIILNFNGKDMTLVCLKSLGKINKDKSFKIHTIVIDNHSMDGSVKAIRQTFPSVMLISNKKNLGWAGGNNVGVRYALDRDADCILLLNNDVLVSKDFLQKLTDALYSEPKIGIVGPKSYLDKNKIIADAGGVIKKNRFFGINRGNGEYDIGQYDKIGQVDYIQGSTMLIKKEVFKKIGLFDDSFFLYYEDVDFCFRARKAGFESVFVPSSIVWHAFGGTSRIGSPLHDYYTTRNHYLFVEKHAPLMIKLKEIFRTPKTAFEFLMAGKKYSLFGIVDYFLRRFGERKYWKV